MADDAADTKPYVVFLPYLPLREPTDVGNWVLHPIDIFDGPWQSARFEELSRRFIAAFRGPNNEPIPHPTLAARRASGCDGALPSRAEQDALRRAVEFASLDQNTTWSSDISSGSMQALQALTTDNADLHVWPIDTVDGHVAQGSGFVVSTLAGGYRIGDDLAITPPEELRLPFGNVTLDSEIATAVYRTIAGQMDDVEITDAARVARAISWLAKAWRNTPAISWEDRIVFLKTAFEALTGKSTTHEAGTKLRRLFEDVIVGDARDDATDHLLWSPTETASRPFTNRSGKSWDCTDLEHWFRAFGEARNDIIHGDSPPLDFDYEEDGSAYNGPMFHTAERLLREATKVELTRLGHDRLFYEATTRAICRHLEDLEPEGS